MVGPPPNAPPDVLMSWVNLLFLHWRVDTATVRALVPEGLDVDEFDGSAWVGLVPFRMENSRFRGFPRLPGLTNFYECNIRTYVRCGSRTGVWFFSLDAETRLPVIGGRSLWSLNYLHSRFEVSRPEGRDGATTYRVTRKGGGGAARTRVVWRKGEALPASEPGTLQHFLTERYWLFTHRRGRILAGRVHHEPWRLHRAVVEQLDDGLIRAAGLTPTGEVHAMHSDRLDVRGWKLIDPTETRT